MDVAALLLELYGRVPPLARDAVEGLSSDELALEPVAGVNTVGWLVWHLARVQDHHVAQLLSADQLWQEGSWAGRFGLEADAQNTGYGHSAAEVRAVRPESAALCVEYLDAVSARTRLLLEGLEPGDLERVVDERYDPPVTMGVRLISIADDSLQHVGQAAYVRGLLERRAG